MASHLDQDKGILRYLAGGAALRAVSTGLGLLLSLPASVLLVRRLGVSDYGALSFGFTIAIFAGILADLGVTTGVARLAGQSQEPQSALWARAGVRISLLAGGAAGVICWLVALVVPPGSRTVLMIVAPVAAVVTLRGALSSLLMTRRRILLVEGSQIAYQLLYNLPVIALAALGLVALPSVAWLQLTSQVGSVLLLVPAWLAATRDSRASSLAPGTTRQLLLFSAPLLLTNVGWIVLQRSDVLLLGGLDGVEAVGLYAPVLRIVDVAAILLGVIGTYYVPLTGNLVQAEDVSGLRSVYVALAKWGLAVTGPLLAMLIVSPQPILVTLFGEQFREAEWIARALAVGYGFHVLAGHNLETLVALGKSKQIGIRSLITVVANLGLNALLIPRFGVMGAALGTAVVYGGLNIASSWLVWRASGIHPFRADYLVLIGVVVFAATVGGVAVTKLGLGDSPMGALLVGAVVGACSIGTLFVSATEEERSLINSIGPFLRRRAGRRQIEQEKGNTT